MLKCHSSAFSITASALEKRSFQNHSPGFLKGDILKNAKELSDSVEVSAFLFYFDGFHKQVFIHSGKFQSHLEDPSTLFLVPAFFLHLGILKPALVSERLDVSDQLEQKFGFIELAFSLCEVRQVQQDLPMHFLRHGDDLLKYQNDSITKAFLFNILELTGYLFVLMFGDGCFH